MDGDILLEFGSNSQLPVHYQFLHGASHAPLSPDVHNFSESGGGAPPQHHVDTHSNHLPSNEINKSVAESVSGINTESAMCASPGPAVHYRECMKNHAAALGGYSIDGCVEFLPSGGEGMDAFQCAACSCHRNFHRKEVEGSTQGCHFCHKDSKNLMCIGPPTPALVAAPTSTKSCMMVPSPSRHAGDPSVYTELRKARRPRTCFTLEQKEKMFFFAESLGWKISKHDESSVQSFCEDAGVPRRIFRVWMHNHKHNMKRE